MNTNTPTDGEKPKEPLLPFVKRSVDQAAASGDAQALCLECAALLEEISGLGIDASGMEFVRSEGGRISEAGAADAVEMINAALKEAMLGLDVPERETFAPYQKLAARTLDHLATAMVRRDEENGITGGGETDVSGRPNKIAEFEPDVAHWPQVTGEQFESDLLYPEDYPLQKTDQYIPKVKEAQAIDDALLRNPYREKPWEPGTLWLGDIYDVVYREMHLDAVPEDEARQALIPCPCIGEAMDLRYGVDFFFLYTDPRSKQSAIVTADCTMNVENKLERGFKADVLVTPRGIYVNPDLPVTSLEQEYTEKEQHGIIKLSRGDRRRAVGKVLAEIVKYKLKMRLPMLLRDPVDLLRKQGNVIPFAQKALRRKLHQSFQRNRPPRRNVQ